MKKEPSEGNAVCALAGRISATFFEEAGQGRRFAGLSPTELIHGCLLASSPAASCVTPLTIEARGKMFRMLRRCVNRSEDVENEGVYIRIRVEVSSRHFEEFESSRRQIWTEVKYVAMRAKARSGDTKANRTNDTSTCKMSRSTVHKTSHNIPEFCVIETIKVLTALQATLAARPTIKHFIF
ncbi:hypothetical protein Pmar_PMAR011523 [Perkinsus marinus ATCC 50983]|uniref:Uncharacterized protein n=1 Tax=Perkinsus marinus (strain ATCC 50983 / TXsc) TaxID=423536 RepID=C5LC14_PERM5|nr:hypothetical protein Pmar_PMAR011523 [Perkinsus marinus ATCC 50983]EER05497.1 hypothetical protein Pmar_PMAR011523 [Perkinsus marinus ATCC 50983]|eukprot:XP_002773681.1 hypothetical protein Pmar_PMAR011523 [Perkinsus marinus ATCC 50983]